MLFRSARHARAAPATPVAELGVVRRIVPSPCNDQFMRLPMLATLPEFARRSLAAFTALLGSLSVSTFARRATLSVASNAFRGRIDLKAQAAQPCGHCHARSTSGHRGLLPRRLFHNSTRTPNQALQRTGPAVTLAAFPRYTRPVRLTRSLSRSSSLSLTPQPARQPGQSLSWGSLGDFDASSTN